MRALCVILLMLSASIVRAQQLPPRDAEVKPTFGTASVSGVVLNDEEQPHAVRRAIVTLSGAGLTPNRSVITDDDGKFAFVNLPAGRFTLMASRASFITSAYGAKRPGRPGTAISVDAGQSVADVVIRMWRGAVVAGTVRDDRGEPVAGVPVTAVPARAPSGTGILTLTNNGTATDNRGQFRIFGLEPGTYVVSAQPASSGALGPLTAPSEAEVDALFDAARRRTSLQPAPSAPPSAPVESAKPFDYAPVYYPGTAALSQAAPIALTAGQEVTGLDFALQRVATSVVSGVVTRSDGAPAGGATIQMTAVWNNAPFAPDSPLSLSATAGPDGAFRIPQVTPGEYRIEAKALVQAPQPQTGGGAMVFTPGNSAPALWAQADVSVLGRDVEGVALRVEPGMTISGKLVFEGTAPPPADMTKFRLWLKPAGLPTKPGTPINRLSFVSSVTARADGTFEILNVTPGPYQLVATSTNATDATWAARSAPFGERDLLDGFVDIARSNAPTVVVTFTDRRTELSGSLQTATGAPASDVFVIAYAADRKYWLPSARRVQATRPDADGHYVIRDLPPGEYFISAVTDVDQDEWQDPAFLEKLLPASAKVTIAEGEKKVFDLRLGKSS